jgi:aminoglycoside N3'-acetyltransferase
MARDGAIYLLSREVKGTNGEVFQQNVTVFAASSTHAIGLVNEQFARLRRISRTDEPAYQVLPDFAVDKVTLDEHTMITAGITFS